MAQVLISRLKKRADFLNARNGARSHERAFVLQLIERKDDDSQLRVGFTVTKKVGNSVIRSRIKRRLREALRHATVPVLASGCDAVLIARIEALNEPFEALTSSVSAGLDKALTKIHAGNGKANVANRVAKGQKRSADV